MGESLGDLGTSLTIYTPPVIVNLMQSLKTPRSVSIAQPRDSNDRQGLYESVSRFQQLVRLFL